MGHSNYSRIIEVWRAICRPIGNEWHKFDHLSSSGIFFKYNELSSSARLFGVCCFEDNLNDTALYGANMLCRLRGMQITARRLIKLDLRGFLLDRAGFHGQPPWSYRWDDIFRTTEGWPRYFRLPTPLSALFLLDIRYMDFGPHVLGALTTAINDDMLGQMRHRHHLLGWGQCAKNESFYCDFSCFSQLSVNLITKHSIEGLLIRHGLKHQI